MSDDLKERLRDGLRDKKSMWLDKYEAADRIEELEERLKAATDDAKEAEAYAEQMENVLIRKKAKLAKAMTGLSSIASNTCCDKCQEAALVARAALAELKGQDDD
jgi:biopolymer transport protein ExbB/TolQ